MGLKLFKVLLGDTHPEYHFVVLVIEIAIGILVYLIARRLGVL